jgi:hypothetical protein
VKKGRKRTFGAGKPAVTGATVDRLLLFDVSVAVCLLAGIGLAAWRPIAVPRTWRLVGCALVLVPLPLAVGLHVVFLHSGSADQALFLTALVAFGIGAVLVLGGEEPDDGAARDDPGPEWWPDFERQFRTFVRTRPREPQRVGRR